MANDRPRPKTTPTGSSGQARRRPPPKIDDSPERLQALEDKALRQCYERERIRWESMRVREHVNYKAPQAYNGQPAKTIENQMVLEKAKRSEWQSLRKWCEGYEIPPLAFVQLVFEILGPDLTRCPEPKQLKSGTYLRLWLKYSPTIVDRLSAALEAQSVAARRAIVVAQSLGAKPDVAYLKACTRGDLAISSLFRYCLATSIGTPTLAHVAKAAEMEAILQFMRHREAYAEAWENVLPKGFVQLAEKRYPLALLTVYGQC